MKPLKFEPLLKSTIWGGNKIIAFKHLDIKQEKVGESWEISGVPGNESIVADGEMKGKKLNEVVAELKENFLGAENYKRFGNEFPLLIKFIDANTDLSIQETLHKLFSISGSRIFIHSEDEAIIKANLADAKQKFGENIPMREHENIRSRQACIRSTIKALELAMKHGTALHICHVSTAEEVEMIRAAKQYNPEITAETSANYLWFCDKDYDRLGSRVKCNPAIKTATDRAALRNALKDGVIDTIGSDHAPHLKEEKAKPYLTCPSGMPSIQQEVAVLLTVADEEQIPLTRIASVLSEKISDMLGIVGRGKIQTGYKADLIIIDPKKKFTVGGSDEGNAGLAYKCGWSPYEGSRLKGMVEDVYLNGTLTVQDGHLITETTAGQRLEFRNR